MSSKEITERKGEMQSKLKVAIIYFDAGSGHRSAAKSLQGALSNIRPSWQITPVNFIELLAYNKVMSSVMRFGIKAFNWLFVREKITDVTPSIRSSFFWRDRLSVNAMKRFWSESPVDMVVSVTPMFNPVFYQSVRLANPNALCVTIPVDFAEIMPGYWFTPQIDQHYLIGTKWLGEQAREAGIAEKFLHHIGGIIIDPGFYQAPPEHPHEEIARLGLDPRLPTGIVSFGGQGNHIASEVIDHLSHVAQADLGVNMIFLCGRNDAVYTKLSGMETPYKKLVLNYLEETPVKYFQLADFVIGKAGAMTINECLVLRKPLIAIKSYLQSGHEAWVKQSGTGVVIDSAAELTSAIRLALSSDHFCQNAAREYHRGIFEAAETLCALAEEGRDAIPNFVPEKAERRVYA
jgi:Glycosyltransferase family 28 C-terminal domain